MKDGLTDLEVEQEIARLKQSPYVKLAQDEQRIRYRQRQYMYKLRCLEKRGKQLAAQGFNPGDPIYRIPLAETGEQDD